MNMHASAIEFYQGRLWSVIYRFMVLIRFLPSSSLVHLSSTSYLYTKTTRCSVSINSINSRESSTINTRFIYSGDRSYSHAESKTINNRIQEVSFLPLPPDASDASAGDASAVADENREIESPSDEPISVTATEKAHLGLGQFGGFMFPMSWGS